ncbi:hypothetical protein [Daejeonia sp. YH14]|uniref:hypothetical protein n=1 Tax=Daejeonia sp. YH14 TaxID=3439042 RepID=UPI003F4939E6
MNTEETTIDKIRLRPRFKIYTDLRPAEYEQMLNEYLKNQQEFSGNINREIATIQVKTEDEPFWKPSLTLRTETEKENAEQRTAIRGIFGPSSSVWTFFMFLYFLFSIGWMVFFTLWFVGLQIRSEDFHWALAASFVMLGCMLLTYLASRIGQSKAKEEMEKLRQFAIESTLKFEKNH